MIDALSDQVDTLLGTDDINVAQMALRTLIVYVFTVAIVRLGNKRFLGKGSAFDIILAIMLGSIMSRAITASSPFFATMFGAGAVLVGLHWLFSKLSYHTPWFGSLVKGDPVLLIEDGHVQRDQARRTAITTADLEEIFRQQGQTYDPSTIERSYLERSGDVSLLPYTKEPRVLSVSVEKGVETVRIELKG
jgi:uncharacterized membrane protein YcaP (DUF421 family)